MTVQEYFEGKNIFLTGGSGFIGKVLIEKFLRTIPEIGNIYVLMRKKRGKTAQDRLKELFNYVLFDRIKKSNPDSLNKVILIEGDIVEEKLGISTEDRKLLIENIDIIYHAAASIRFDDPLYKAILINIRSTRDIAELALESKRLKAFIHVSTAYCQADKRYVEEKLYPPYGDWREAIALAENADSYDKTIMEYLTAKYINPKHNTYTYAKSLAEQVVNDLCLGKIPTAIVRPTIVVSSLEEPMAGWIDNLNGPIGLFYAGSTGILKCVYGDANAKPDNVSVDAVINVLIVATYDVLKNPSINEVKVFNNSTYKYGNLTIQEYVNYGLITCWTTPVSDRVWYPETYFTTIKILYIQIMLLTVLPALLIDFVIKMFGGQPRLFNIQKKIFVANTVVAPFILKTWYFNNDKTVELEGNLSKDDIELFGFTRLLKPTVKQLFDQFNESATIVQTYMFNKKPDYDKNRKVLYRFWILHITTKALAGILLIWILVRSNIHLTLYNRVANYIESL